MGVAQSVLDGYVGDDPAYLDERWWYNPLVPTLVGLASRVTATPLHEAYATFGVYLNLLAPAAFYALLAALFQRGAALAGLVAFLFLGSTDLMSWMHATYSPWLWSCNLAQGFFYLALLAWVRALEQPSARRATLAGVTLGLAALAHTAPALILVGIVLITSTAELVRARAAPKALKKTLVLTALTGFIAALVASPFWLGILVHYGARIQNAVPLTWVANELLVERWRELGDRLISLRGLGALVGLAALLVPRGRRFGHARAALLTWGAIAAAGLAYGYGVELEKLPPFLPSWHFYFYLQALESALFGVGVIALVRLASELAQRVPRLAAVPPTFEQRATAAAVGALFLVVFFRWSDYAQRLDLVENRRASLAYARAPSTELYPWILENSAPTDVFLADPERSFFAVLPAGRKLVTLQDLFSNPYVDVRVRARDAARMYGHLTARRLDAFRKIAAEYRVRYVTLAPSERDALRKNPIPILKRVFTSRNKRLGADVYVLRSAPAVVPP